MVLKVYKIIKKRSCLPVTLIYYNGTQLGKVFTEHYYVIMFNSN